MTSRNKTTLTCSFDRAAVVRSLDLVRQLPANWNGYEAAPILPDIIEAARQFILGFPDDAMPTPHVVPMSRGRLQLEWHRGSRSLELEFETPTTVHYLKWDPEAGVEEEDVLSTTQTKELHDLLSWFVSE